MASVRTYTLIYIALLAMGTGKFVFFEFTTYQIALAATILLAIGKTLLISGYFMHLVEEPRSISYVMVIALFMVFLLTIAAGYSIQ